MLANRAPRGRGTSIPILKGNTMREQRRSRRLAALALSAAVVFAACGSDDEPAAEEPAAEEPAGPTQEAIDPVRGITNLSSGKMGFALAKNAMLRGADVTLVMGKCDSEPPVFVNTVKVQSAKDMYDAVIERADSMDIIVKAAAVADYRPKNVSSEKVKKQDGNMSIELERTDDILKTLGERKNGQFICGFSMETENMLENSRKKLEKKNCDMIVANNLKQDGAGFGGNTNIVTLITKDDEVQLEKMTKDEVAEKIFDFILSR